MDILRSYSFQIIALGTVILSLTAGMIGVLNVYKGQSLIGDAVGHASFPGVVLMFMLMQTKQPTLLLLGAMLSGTLAYYLVQLSVKRSKIGLDATLAIYLSGFFGLGMVLKTLIKGNPNFQKASQAGIDSYIFGQASYMLEKDVMLIAVISAACILVLLLFYKELKLFVFDPGYAISIGISSQLLGAVLLFLTIALIAVGIKAVGSILISSLLILPCVCASQWSKRFHIVLLLSALFGAVSAFIGTYISTTEKGFSTGPSIIVVACVFALFSMLFGSNNGYITKLLRRRVTKK